MIYKLTNIVKIIKQHNDSFKLYSYGMTEVFSNYRLIYRENYNYESKYLKSWLII